MNNHEQFAVFPTRGAAVSLTTLAREMAALTQVMMSPPPFPQDAAYGDGNPVIVIPGFLAPDMSTARLREFLAGRNFQPHSWTAGVNIGPMRNVLRQVERHVLEIADKTGRSVALVGVSLGGMVAREVAKSCPGEIARLITIVSPFHVPVITPLAPLAQAAALLWDGAELEALAKLSEPPPVPLTAIVSRDYGITDWRASIPMPGEGIEIMEISGPHMTVCSNPDVQRLVADRLARPS